MRSSTNDESRARNERWARDDLEASNDSRTVPRSRAIAGGAARCELDERNEGKAKIEAATGATTPAQASAPKPGSKGRGRDRRHGACVALPKRFRESPLLYIADPFRRSGETRYLSIENSHEQLPFHKEGRDASSTTALFESMLPTTVRPRLVLSLL